MIMTKVLLYSVFAAAALFSGGIFVADVEGSTCDLKVWWTETGIVGMCPEQICEICDTAGVCKVKNEMSATGNPVTTCLCRGDQGGTHDTCYSGIEWDPIEPRVVCMENPNPNCDCPGIGWPQPTCKHLTPGDFYVLPTEPCYCHGGAEDKDN